jgi:hypothetical protein
MGKTEVALMKGIAGGIEHSRWAKKKRRPLTINEWTVTR